MTFKRTTLTLLLLTTPLATAQNVTQVGLLPTKYTSLTAPQLDEDRNLLYYQEGQFLNVYDLQQQKTIQKYDIPGLKTFALSPDHTTLMVSIVTNGQRFQTFNTTTWQQNPDQRRDFSIYERLQFTPDGRKVFARAGDYALHSMDANTLEITEVKAPQPTFAVSPDGKTLALASKGKLQFLQPNDATVLKTLPGPSENTAFTALAFSPDGKKLAGGGNKDIVVWDAQTGTELQHIKTDLTNLSHLVFSPNNRYLVASNKFIVDQLNIFDLTDGHRVTIPNDGHKYEYGATFTSDGKTLYVATDGGVRIYNTATLNPMDAQVLLNVDPQDAQLLVGGKTPKLDAGGVAKIFSGVPVEVQVTKPFFKTYTTTLNLKGGETKNLNVVLERDKGTLSLTSTPRGAVVFIDGEEKGKTPLKLSKFEAGEYTITLKLNDYQDFTQRITVQGSQDNTVTAALVLNPGIKITSKPTGAQVFIGDQLVCEKTPCTLRNLPPSIQEFTFKLDGYSDLKAKAVVPEEGTGNLDVTLKK